MLLTEYDEAETLELFKKEAYDEGEAKGAAKGEAKGKAEINGLYTWLRSLNRTDDILRAVDNNAIQEELLEEYRNAHNNSEK